MFDHLLRPRAWKQSGDYSGRKGRDGQKKNIGKANKKWKRKSKKKQKMKWIKKEGKKEGKGVPWPHAGYLNWVWVLQMQ